ncbi:MAG: hypothetical protein M3P84_05000 [Chloroflexota bacterium]|nr:hypothetical protein [Chloroflexota bacterium]
MRLRLGVGLIVAVCSVGLAACGGGERQDEREVEGEFPVEITGAEFPAKQKLANQTELLLSVENTGEETIPNLAVTVFTVANPDESVDEVDASAADPSADEGSAGDDEELAEEVEQQLQEELDEAAEDEEDSAEELATDPEATVSASGEPTMAGGPFSVISQQQGLAIPSRPVWILEQGFPRLVGSEPGPPPPGELSGTGGTKAVQTNTFAFGPVEPDETLDLVWQVTPVQAGTYTVSYRIAAGLQGNAVAVTDDGSVPEGEFIVQISDAPPQTRVNDAGEVVPVKPGDVIGQAGSSEQDDSTATTTP